MFSFFKIKKEEEEKQVLDIYNILCMIKYKNSFDP